jgi:hypothetical protein
MTPTITLTPTDNYDAVPQRNFYASRIITVSWNRVSWATAYQLEIDTDTAFTAPFTYQIIVSPDTLVVSTPPLFDGTYYMHVRARNASGQWGPWSPWDTFTIDAP